jgi:hypothetical protein
MGECPANVDGRARLRDGFDVAIEAGAELACRGRSPAGVEGGQARRVHPIEDVELSSEVPGRACMERGGHRAIELDALRRGARIDIGGRRSAGLRQRGAGVRL